MIPIKSISAYKFKPPTLEHWLGTDEPTPSWGLMLSGSAPSYAEKAPWVAIFPGLAISLAVFGFNLFGDSLRDALDPKLRHRTYEIPSGRRDDSDQACPETHRCIAWCKEKPCVVSCSIKSFARKLML
jgi:hypothetical protein